MLTLAEREQDGVTVLVFTGSLDASTEDKMQAKSAELLAAKKVRIVFDLSQLTQLDSAGVGSLVGLFKKVKALQGNIICAGVGAQPLLIFKLLRLDRAFEMVPAVADAVAKLAPKS